MINADVRTFVLLPPSIQALKTTLKPLPFFKDLLVSPLVSLLQKSVPDSVKQDIQIISVFILR